MAKRSRDPGSVLRLEPERRAAGPFRRPAVEPEVARVVSADGTQLHVRSYGPADAEPIVLIHGSREVELLGVGHASNLESVERFNAEIVDLRNLPRPGNRHPDD